MKYRAKVTKICSWVENNYNVNRYPLIHDSKDYYIEVDDEDEAELLENINELQEQKLSIQKMWRDKYQH